MHGADWAVGVARKVDHVERIESLLRPCAAPTLSL